MFGEGRHNRRRRFLRAQQIKTAEENINPNKTLTVVFNSLS